MRIFVTGATGFVGSAVVQELIGAGHQVRALARSDAAAQRLKEWGADVHRGDLEDLDSLARGAANADGVIHCAFNHDFSKFEANSAMDRRAIETLGGTLEGSERPLIVTSGLALIAPGRLALESDQGPKPSPVFPRASEATAAELAARGVRVAVVRLPPTVHGEGDHQFVPTLVRLARERRAAAYIGDGSNRWAAVHRFDAARVYRLAIERGAVDGPYHAIAEEGIAFRDIAGAIGRGLDVPVVSKSGSDAKDYFTWFEMFAGMDLAGSSARTRARLGWEPERPGLLEDIAHAGYV
jgi:nucleoside-diphosphate-sugar epimerase